MLIEPSRTASLVLRGVDSRILQIKLTGGVIMRRSRALDRVSRGCVPPL